jgi:hypothetical protein
VRSDGHERDVTWQLGEGEITCSYSKQEFGRCWDPEKMSHGERLEVLTWLTCDHDVVSWGWLFQDWRGDLRGSKWLESCSTGFKQVVLRSSAARKTDETLGDGCREM